MGGGRATDCHLPQPSLVAGGRWLGSSIFSRGWLRARVCRRIWLVWWRAGGWGGVGWGRRGGLGSAPPPPTATSVRTNPHRPRPSCRPPPHRPPPCAQHTRPSTTAARPCAANPSTKTQLIAPITTPPNRSPKPTHTPNPNRTVHSHAVHRRMDATPAHDRHVLTAAAPTLTQRTDRRHTRPPQTTNHNNRHHTPHATHVHHRPTMHSYE